MILTQIAGTADSQKPVWRRGTVAGVVGGVCYAVFVEIVNMATNGAEAFCYPFRQIGAVVLGPGALLASYDVFIATMTGTVLHLAIAALFGILLAWAVARMHLFDASGVIGLGLVAGLVFYVLDLYVLFPAAFPWFLENNRITQSLGHALFGMITGAWLGLRLSLGNWSN